MKSKLKIYTQRKKKKPVDRVYKDPKVNIKKAHIELPENRVRTTVSSKGGRLVQQELKYRAMLEHFRMLKEQAQTQAARRRIVKLANTLEKRVNQIQKQRLRFVKNLDLTDKRYANHMKYLQNVVRRLHRQTPKLLDSKAQIQWSHHKEDNALKLLNTVYAKYAKEHKFKQKLEKVKYNESTQKLTNRLREAGWKYKDIVKAIDKDVADKYKYSKLTQPFQKFDDVQTLRKVRSELKKTKIEAYQLTKLYKQSIEVKGQPHGIKRPEAMEDYIIPVYAEKFRDYQHYDSTLKRAWKTISRELDIYRSNRGANWVALQRGLYNPPTPVKIKKPKTEEEKAWNDALRRGQIYARFDPEEIDYLKSKHASYGGRFWNLIDNLARELRQVYKVSARDAKIIAEQMLRSDVLDPIGVGTTTQDLPDNLQYIKEDRFGYADWTSFGEDFAKFFIADMKDWRYACDYYGLNRHQFLQFATDPKYYHKWENFLSMVYLTPEKVNATQVYRFLINKGIF